jgi:anti-anti-sigma regulatory factor
MSLKLSPRPASTNSKVQSALTRPVAPSERSVFVVVLRGNADMAVDLDNLLFCAMRYRTGDVVIDFTETESIDQSSIHVLAKAQRLLNSKGRKLMFRSPSRFDALVRDLYDGA